MGLYMTCQLPFEGPGRCRGVPVLWLVFAPSLKNRHRRSDQPSVFDSSFNILFRPAKSLLIPSSYPSSYPQDYNQPHQQQQQQQHPASPTSPTMRKRQRTIDAHGAPDQQVQQSPTQPGQPVTEDAFINDHDAVDSGADDDDDEGEKPKSDKKAGRRKIKIEFIQDKSRRHITFSKRKAGIMKKAYELSTLTGTQVLLLVVSETGLVYTFTTAKLQPLVTQPEGKNLIQACLNAPHGSLPSSMPVGPPLGRSSPMTVPSVGASNLPGGLSINAPPGGAPLKDDDGPDDDDRDGPGSNKRRRRASSAAGRQAGQTSPHSPSAAIPPPLNIPGGAGAQQAQPQGTPPQQQAPPPQISLGSPTSPQQGHSVPGGGGAPYSPASGYAPQHHGGDPSGGGAGMYSNHMMGAPPSYSYSPQGAQNGPGQQQLGGLAAAAQQHGHWTPGPPPPQYQRR